MRVAVLLATYNGERYLGEQLNSLLAQTFTNFTIHVSDDASQDDTAALLDAYALRFPDKFVIHNNLKRLGAKDNFFFLLSRVEADRYFFSDQDDVWYPEKMERLLKKMGVKEMPYLVHCDLEVVDESLKPLYPSFWARMGIKPEEPHPLAKLLRYDAVTGCALLFNCALRERVLATGFPTMHDQWLGLTAAIFGGIGLVREPLVRYRQHAQNVIGAKPPTFFKWLISGLRRHLLNDCPRRKIARLLLEKYDLPKDAHDTVSRFLKK